MSKFPTNRTIRFANAKDIPSIMAILAENLLSNKPIVDETSLETTGFLIHGFKSADLKKAIQEDQNHILLVAVEDQDVVGYALSYDLQYRNPEWITSVQVLPGVTELLASEKVLYHRHIAKKLTRKGVGKQLLSALLNAAAARGYEYVVCQIVQSPVQNKASMRLHEQLGFSMVGLSVEENITSKIYLKKL